jgi:hypothetical protein
MSTRIVSSAATNAASAPYPAIVTTMRRFEIGGRKCYSQKGASLDSEPLSLTEIWPRVPMDERKNANP